MKADRFKLIGAVHLILMRNNEGNQEVLLLRRFNTGYEDGNYSVPAGHLDGNESSLTAMRREAMEEVGIELIDPIFAHIVHYHTDDERFQLFYACSQWENTPFNKEPNKADDLRWFSVHELPENMVPYVRLAIDSFLAGKNYSEYGW
jgi:8-oxo-dGTP pyrophosphatase MutT (NUDIX family)